MSEVWEQADERPLYASAHLVKGRELLCIRSPGPAYSELKRIMSDLHGSANER